LARLTTSQRSKLSASDFAGPGRSFAMPDKGHAKAAIVDSARAVKAGHITPAQRQHIVNRAQNMLAK
jgi:hypothetical protein